MHVISLDGKVAIVTGAAGGIGRAYAQALGKAGAKVVLADVDERAARAAAKELELERIDAFAVGVDVGSELSVRDMARLAVDRYGGIDILVNNAALMAEIPFGPVTELPLDFWDRVLRVNLTGPWLCTKAVLPAMKQRGRGKIINQSSGGAFGPAGVYGVTKLGLVSLTVTLARELAPHRINVNAIAPGFVDTPAGRRAAPPEVAELITRSIPLKGIGSTDDVIGALLFLASSDSDWVTGQTLNVDGGWVMRI
jgi:NAD(P)-dependent dehydrogenase (short-subunit alcohol dehydrogenase family)